MATTLFLRETTANGIGAYRDLITTAGATEDVTCVTNTTSGGTQIQLTKTAGGAVREWITGRAPAGGFTLAGTVNFALKALESNMSANVGLRARLFKRTALAVETEVPGGPWNDGVELGTGNTLMTWSGTPTSTVFLEDDRLIFRAYLTNVGTMASGYTATVQYDEDNTHGYISITENVTFKAESVAVSPILRQPTAPFLHNLLR